MTARLALLAGLAISLAPAGCAKREPPAPHVAPQEVAALRAKLLGQPAAGAGGESGGAKSSADP